MRQYLDQSHDNAWFKRDDSLPTKTWKELFRIAHNWRVGRARTTRLPLRSSVLPEISLSTEVDDLDGEAAEESAESLPAASSSSTTISGKKLSQEQTKVVWHGQYYFVASKDTQEGGLPSIDVFRIEPTSHDPTKLTSIVSSGLKGKGTPGSLSITEMQLDAAKTGKEGVRLAVFYSNGQFSLFRLKHMDPQAMGQLDISEEYFSPQTSSRPTVMARLHSPILVTSLSDCTVRFRSIEERLNEETGKMEIHVSVSPPTMRTSLCFAPMTMRLSRRGENLSGFAKLKARQSPQRFQLSLAFATPYYPAAFTVGIQIFNITIPPRSKSNPLRRQPLEIFARSAIAVPPHSLIPGDHNQAIVNTIEHDGPYIVASRNDNTISVYKVLDSLSDSWLSSLETVDSPPLSPAKMNAIPLKLRHVRTLFGHTAAVDAVGLLNGRCVSTGRDGLKVWDLPQDPTTRTQSEDDEEVQKDSLWNNNTPVSERNASVPAATLAPANVNSPIRCQWIGLDTSRIVTVCQGQDAEEKLIKVYHFE